MCLGRPYLGRHLYAGSPGLQCSRSIGRSIQGLWECLLVPVPVTVQTMTLVGGRGGPWLSPRGLMPRLLGRESLVACAPGPTCGCPGVVSALILCHGNIAANKCVPGGVLGRDMLCWDLVPGSSHLAMIRVSGSLQSGAFCVSYMPSTCTLLWLFSAC